MHIAIASYKRSGDSATTAVWFCVSNEKTYFRTIIDSAKVFRIRNNPQVKVAICTETGEVTGQWINGSARILDETDDHLSQAANEIMDNKYGEQRVQMTRWVKEQGKTLVYVEVSCHSLDQ